MGTIVCEGENYDLVRRGGHFENRNWEGRYNLYLKILGGGGYVLKHNNFFKQPTPMGRHKGLVPEANFFLARFIIMIICRLRSFRVYKT